MRDRGPVGAAGRTEEQQVTDEKLARVGDRRRRVVLVGGDPGQPVEPGLPVGPPDQAGAVEGERTLGTPHIRAAQLAACGRHGGECHGAGGLPVGQGTGGELPGQLRVDGVLCRVGLLGGRGVLCLQAGECGGLLVVVGLDAGLLLGELLFGRERGGVGRLGGAFEGGGAGRVEHRRLRTVGA